MSSTGFPNQGLDLFHPSRNCGMQNPQLVTSEFSDVCATCLCRITYVASLTKRRFVVSSSGTTIRGRGGNVVIQQVVGATHHEMWCLTKHPRGGLRKKRSCQIPKFLKINYNSRGSKLSRCGIVLKNLTSRRKKMATIKGRRRIPGKLVFFKDLLKKVNQVKREKRVQNRNPGGLLELENEYQVCQCSRREGRDSKGARDV